MRPIAMIAAGALAFAALLPLARPAHAQFGAIAYDGKTGSYGGVANRPTRKAAIAGAIAKCGTSGCRVVVRVGPKACGAFASTKDHKGVGAAARPSIKEARNAALADCNKRNAGECIVRGSFCNR
jgi:hypothetical protein